MAFDNVTFFELHLDDARFGGEHGESDETPGEMEAEPSASGRRGAPLDVDPESAEAIAVRDRSRPDPPPPAF